MNSFPYPIEELRSPHEKTSARAWSAAYPLLWEAGMRVARMRLLGEAFEQEREDITSTALQQFVRGFVTAETDSFNQIETWDDCLGMLRHIVRSRVTDFFRSRERNRVDVVEELPEEIEEGRAALPFTLPELLREVDTLEPNPPVPQVFRERFLEGRSTDDIATTRKLSRNTLVSYYAKGLRTLRERLARLDRP